MGETSESKFYQAFNEHQRFLMDLWQSVQKDYQDIKSKHDLAVSELRQVKSVAKENQEKIDKAIKAIEMADKRLSEIEKANHITIEGKRSMLTGIVTKDNIAVIIIAGLALALIFILADTKDSTTHRDIINKIRQGVISE